MPCVPSHPSHPPPAMGLNAGPRESSHYVALEVISVVRTGLELTILLLQDDRPVPPGPARTAHAFLPSLSLPASIRY